MQKARILQCKAKIQQKALHDYVKQSQIMQKARAGQRTTGKYTTESS